MALYLKQNFAPPVLSRKWIAMKFRPNMLIYSHHNIILILESGLLFREDSIEVEQESSQPETVWHVAGGSKTGWFTMGEKIAAICSVGTFVAMFPPRSVSRSSLLLIASYLLLPFSIRTIHRQACRGTLRTLLTHMRDYLALARRAAACLRDCTQLQNQLNSVSSVLESMHTMLCRQQSELSVIMSRASAALLGNAPWLRSDVAWHAVQRDETDNLWKIHHAFLVVQSTLLKHIALAHNIPSARAQKLYKNHNERIYWIHHTLIQNLIVVFTENYDALERMYRLLKNYGSNDSMTNKKMGHAVTDNWLYSDVHSGIARANLELKVALTKCNNLDSFLDSCALNKQDIDLRILNKDIDNLIDDITKCLSTAQSSQIRLKKLQNKFVNTVNEIPNGEEKVVENDKDILTIDDRDPEAKDEVFYFVKTVDDEVDNIQSCIDSITGPGNKETETTKIVLNELKRKLVKREDLMRERERQALVKTMPELKDNVPEFPRQIKIEEVLDRKGFIAKLPKRLPKKRKFRKYKIQSPIIKHAPKYKLKMSSYKKECDIQTPLYEANSNLTAKSRFLTFFKGHNCFYVTRWFKRTEKTSNREVFSDLSDGLSDVESSAFNKTVHQAVNHRPNRGDSASCQNHHRQAEAKNFKFSKKDLELTPSSSESDLEMYNEKHMALLNDVRRYRAARKKNFPVRNGILTIDTTVDESLRPIEYSLGAGLAMASVLQAGRAALGREEVFIGDGEVSEDSGNDEDA
ncbi:uncharacterized protein LOC113226103 [Hyposmocoma kahamanoa]|uniref:uncharacterized protein LOC113226103 n=1 Tax=Hyposmocoma kahamanoa TaxID=1477025 RepID=UPI000E6D8B07|nr:uncharacterized protein LOC113226103 [Hyposmocoma kahamanoa]